MKARFDYILTRVTALIAVLMIGAAVIVLARVTDQQDAAQWAQVTPASQSEHG
jgi:hypothetical protein